ncbi:hypothetical protein Pfo_021856, partial [Paulownia fortunei]
AGMQIPRGHSFFYVAFGRRNSYTLEMRVGGFPSEWSSTLSMVVPPSSMSDEFRKCCAVTGLLIKKLDVIATNAHRIESMSLVVDQHDLPQGRMVAIDMLYPTTQVKSTNPHCTQLSARAAASKPMGIINKDYIDRLSHMFDYGLNALVEGDLALMVTTITIHRATNFRESVEYFKDFKDVVKKATMIYNWTIHECWHALWKAGRFTEKDLMSFMVPNKKEGCPLMGALCDISILGTSLSFVAPCSGSVDPTRIVSGNHYGRMFEAILWEFAGAEAPKVARASSREATISLQLR